MGMDGIDRRQLIRALGAGAAVLGAGKAQALPVLSPDNFGLSHHKAARGNGWVEIDAAGFEANIAELRRMIGPGHPICAVMKGDGYGHSIALLIPSIKRSGIDCIGVTANDEARVARALGYRGRIARLRTATPWEVEDGLRYRIEELTGNLAHAQAMAAIAARKGRRLDIHFALNSTGMGRNGMDLATDPGRNDARALMAIQGLRIVGIMSHFPVEDVADVRQSLARFLEESDWAMAAGGLDRSKIQRHVANTYATFHVPEARLDMVRVGGGLVGDSYPGFERFGRIMTAKSRLASINFYPAGSSVNYDRTYRLARDSWLANVPVGYADGYRRAFSFRNTPEPDKLQSHALIHGRRAPVLGRVTMNTIMLDVTDFHETVAMDDEVVFFGTQGSDRITAQELEAAAATLNTEVYLIFGNSMPRVLKP
jgi:alanine racemase